MYLEGKNIWESEQPYYPNEEPPEKCLLDEFFKKEQKKPPHLRNQGAFLVCRCKKCSRRVIA